ETIVSSGNVYRYDRVTGINTLISKSITNPNLSGNKSCDLPAISSDGSLVSFSSSATNLVVGQTGTSYQSFQWNAAIGKTRLITFDATGVGSGNGDSFVRAVSADGRYTEYTSVATNLVAGFSDGNGTNGVDVFLFDSVTNVSSLVSHEFGNLLVSA